jgi:iron complex transport system permease protein
LGGALLGLAGAIAQGVFRNPLADPYLLGSASGASLGVALFYSVAGAGLYVLDWPQRLGLTGAAFVGAWLAVVLTVVLARGAADVLRLLLCGVIVGVVLGAMSSLVLLLHPQAYMSMQGFLLGSTAFVGWGACGAMLLVLLPSLLVAWVGASVLDALTLGEATAHTLGVAVRPMRTLLIAVVALATASCVAQMGLLSFVGLVSAHWVRSMVRTTYRGLLWCSAWAGGVLLLLADVLARSVLAPQELPVGVLTALLGGAYLLYLMRRSAMTPTDAGGWHA